MSGQPTDKERAILILWSRDAKGLGARVNKYLSYWRANVEDESSFVMSNLGIQNFVFTAPRESMKEIGKTYKGKFRGLHPQFELVVGVNGPEEHELLEYRMNVIAEDRPGIAAEIKQKLLDFDANIMEVRGRSEWCYEREEFVCRVTFRLTFSSARDVRHLRERIQVWEETKFWEIDLRPMDEMLQLPSLPPSTSEGVSVREVRRLLATQEQ